MKDNVYVGKHRATIYGKDLELIEEVTRKEELQEIIENIVHTLSVVEEYDWFQGNKEVQDEFVSRINERLSMYTDELRRIDNE